MQGSCEGRFDSKGTLGERDGRRVVQDISRAQATLRAEPHDQVRGEPVLNPSSARTVG